jgi:alanine racemase
VHDPLQVKLLEDFRGSFRLTVWMKIDTGINRLGFRPEDFPPAFARLRALKSPPLREIRVLTHLARADDRDDSATLEQVRRFRAAAGSLGLATSIGNSAGIFGWADAAGDWVRPGLALYGVSPFADVRGHELDLKPVMTLESAIIGLRWVPRGESVGYGGTWTAQRESRIAIVAGGYGDGILRSLQGASPVLIDGRRAPLVGRVSMDMIAVDVTDLPEPHVGTRCLLWGPGLPVEEIAAHAGTVSYEMLCGVRQRVPHEAI